MRIGADGGGVTTKDEGSGENASAGVTTWDLVPNVQIRSVRRFARGRRFGAVPVSWPQTLCGRARRWTGDSIQARPTQRLQLLAELTDQRVPFPLIINVIRHDLDLDVKERREQAAA